MEYESWKIESWERKFQLDEFVCKWRSPGKGPISINESAELADVQVLYANLGGVLKGAIFIEDRKIVLNDTLNQHERDYAFCHELGHLALACNGVVKAHAKGLSSNEQEDFCNYFAERFLNGV